jgi:hypothetical protein
MELSPSWEATSRSATQEFPKFYWTRMFITLFTKANHQSLTWARWIHSISLHSVPLRSILILYSPTTYRFSCWSLSFWVYHQNPVCILLLPMRATCSVSVTLLTLNMFWTGWCKEEVFVGWRTPSALFRTECFQDHQSRGITRLTELEARMERPRNAHRMLPWEPEGRKQRGSPRLRWEDNIEMDPKSVACKDVSLDWDRWGDFVWW